MTTSEPNNSVFLFLIGGIQSSKRMANLPNGIRGNGRNLSQVSQQSQRLILYPSPSV